jgi:hypothetical protein
MLELGFPWREFGSRFLPDSQRLKPSACAGVADLQVVSLESSLLPMFVEFLENAAVQLYRTAALRLGSKYLLRIRSSEFKGM